MRIGYGLALSALIVTAACSGTDGTGGPETVDQTQEAVITTLSWYRAYQPWQYHSNWPGGGYFTGQDHFYTTSQSEVSSAAAGGWNYEGIAGTCLSGPATSNGVTATKLIRMWNLDASDHFYTTDPQEAANASHNGWVYEDFNECYVFTQQVSGTCPIYRSWSNDGRDHFYTLSWSETVRAQSLPAGTFGVTYAYERIAGYMYPYNANTCPG